MVFRDKECAQTKIQSFSAYFGSECLLNSGQLATGLLQF